MYYVSIDRASKISLSLNSISIGELCPSGRGYTIVYLSVLPFIHLMNIADIWPHENARAMNTPDDRTSYTIINIIIGMASFEICKPIRMIIIWIIISVFCVSMLSPHWTLQFMEMKCIFIGRLRASLSKAQKLRLIHSNRNCVSNGAKISTFNCASPSQVIGLTLLPCSDVLKPFLTRQHMFKLFLYSVFDVCNAMKIPHKESRNFLVEGICDAIKWNRNL